MQAFYVDNSLIAWTAHAIQVIKKTRISMVQTQCVVKLADLQQQSTQLEGFVASLDQSQAFISAVRFSS